jgi:citrate synthase
MSKALETRISTFDEKTITWRGRDLVDDLLGKMNFAEVLYLLITGREPDATQAKVLDVCLVTLMEHGLTPHALVTRLVADCNPDQVQIAMAAGLTCVGDVFSGTMEGCGKLLQQGLREPDSAAWCKSVATEYRAEKKAIPGFGHPIHKPDDPRSGKLFEIARNAGVEGRAIALLEELSAQVDIAYGRHMTINVTGALSALMMEIGIPTEVMRCIAVTSRAGGLSAHIMEEKETRSGRQIVNVMNETFAYAG